MKSNTSLVDMGFLLDKYLHLGFLLDEECRPYRYVPRLDNRILSTGLIMWIGHRKAGDSKADVFERANLSYEDAEVSDREINLIKMWRQSQVLPHFFWRCFTKEYLPSLTERKKRREKKRSLKEGDVVLVAEPNQPQGLWPLGRIISTQPGQDGLVWAVTVCTQNGEYKRPLTKLCLLEEAIEWNC